MDPKLVFKLKEHNCSYNAYLDADPEMKQWAELNPEMATNKPINAMTGNLMQIG